MKRSVDNNIKGRWFFKKETSKTPFGMTMPGRSYNAHTYRHGFTGHEKESDLAEGIYTTEYRLYDARVGRWLSVDPLFEKYVSMSPYNYCMLNPVMLVDLDGEAPQKTSVDFRLSLGIQLGANAFDCTQLELNVISVDLFSYHRVETEAEGNVTEKKIDYIGNDGGATIKSHVAGGVGLPVIGEIKAEAHNQFNTNRNRFDEDDSDADIDVDMAKISAGFKCIIGVDFEINADFIDENTFKKAWEEIKVFGREISNYLIEE
jgi:RHS repeat-associated protein